MDHFVVTLLVSLALSAAVCLALAAPLRDVLERTCPGALGARFWERFTAVMLFLIPLLVAIAFGMPAPYAWLGTPLDVALPGIVSAVLWGLLIALAAVGLRLSTLIRALAAGGRFEPTSGRESPRAAWQEAK
jgi:hypothetical protein